MRLSIPWKWPWLVASGLSVGALAANPADHWVATDGLGRTITTAAEAPEPRGEKTVGVFYYIWVGNHTRKVHDITRIIKQPKDRRKWGARNGFHFWGEPEYGYFHASDPWVIRHDMQMLANAGVDFVFFDVTNALTYPSTVRAVGGVIEEMRRDGIAAPSFCFTTNAKSGRTMNKVYDEIYGPNLFADCWFRWQGKPLILGDAEDPVLRPEVRRFFTIKRSWAWTGHDKGSPTGWFGDGRDKWPWLDSYPQGYGWSEAPTVPEQVTVSTANHPGGNEIGKSFHDGKLPPVNEDYLTKFTGHGLQFEEQWKRAHEVDPPVVMITQWNEWLAQRFVMDDRTKGLLRSWKGSYAGRPIAMGDSYFIDVFNQEFNRDIAPMKGGHTDNYYYQMVSHIRRFKGMARPQPRPEMRTMAIDGKFEEWGAVTTVHRDPPGDTMHRRFEGTDRKTTYTNTTGRNDIVESRVVCDAENVFFHALTREPLTPHTDPNWMLLFIDLDQSKETGWEGYDLRVNGAKRSATATGIEKWGGSAWVAVDECEFAYAGRHLELRVPGHHFTESERGFDYKWADNPQHLNDITAFFLDGDTAPDRRFNFRY